MSLFSEILLFIVGVVFIWIAGKNLALLADEIAQRFHISKAFIGAFLLAIATSLPEIVATITASAIGNAPLAINNLLGGIPLQTSLLAIADVCIVRGGALSYFTPTLTLVLSGVFLIIQISLVILSYVYQDFFSIFGIGSWSIIFLIIYFVMLFSLRKQGDKEKWVPTSFPHKKKEKKKPKAHQYSIFKLGIYFIIASLVVLIGGFDVAYFADKISKKTQLSGSFIGATFLAFATSLPELSTTFGAIRINAFTMAFANIFGSNALMIALFFIADVAYRKGPIVEQLTPSSILLASTGIIMTSVYLWGILTRRKKEIFKMGIDSLIVLILYFLSLIFLYQLT